jgi:putative adhesin
MVKLRAMAPAVVIAAVLGTGCAINLSADQYLGKEDKTFAVTGKPEVSLKTFDGSIEVKTWDKPEVALTIERRAGSQAEAEALKVTTSQDGNRIVVEALQPEKKVEVGVGFHVGRSVRFVVTVPVNTDLVARTGDGAIAVTGVHGRLELRSGDGSVTGTGLDGEVAAHTGDGSITLEGVKGTVDVNTGDGSVRVAGSPSVLKAHTGDGSVGLAIDSATTVKGDWEITTGDGSVSLELPAGLNANVDASTGDGRISASDFGLEAEGEERRALHGKLGAGGPVLKVRTGDGSITFAKK